MTSRIRLAVVALLIAAGLGAASPASADLPVPACPSHDDLAARLRAEGFRAPAANNFARLTVGDCA